MREAIGLDLNTSVEESINAFWSLGTFLKQGTIKENKASKDFDERKKLIASFNSSASKLKAAIKNKELEEIYEYLK